METAFQVQSGDSFPLSYLHIIPATRNSKEAAFLNTYKQTKTGVTIATIEL